MDIRKMMSFCTSCISPNRVCLPLQSTFSPVWSTTAAPILAEDGGICLADYSPNGESMCALSEVTFSEKAESTPSSCSYNSMSLSNGSFVSSNESLAEKASSLTMDFTDSGNTNEDIDQLSVDSMISNEAEAIISFSSSLKDNSSQSLDKTQSSLLSFAELAEPCGGEGLAEGLSCSSEGDSALNSFSSISRTPTPTTEGSVSPVMPVTYVIEEMTRL